MREDTNAYDVDKYDQPESFAEFSRYFRDVYTTWVLFEAAFRDSGARVDLLRSAAPLFFAYARWHMLYGVILELCKLVDPVDSRVGNQIRGNLTLERVYRDLEACGVLCRDGDGFLKRAFDYALKRLRAEEFKRMRDRFIAHTDFAVAIGTEQVPELPIGLVEQVVEVVSRFQHRAETLLRGKRMDESDGYSLPAHFRERIVRDVEKLEAWLREGAKREAALGERMTEQDP